MVMDKQGRPIHIYDRPNGWKISPYQRDQIYQAFLAQFPDRDCTSEAARSWMKLEAERWPIDADRIRDFIGEALAAERGELDRSWGWWVGCSVKSLGA